MLAAQNAEIQHIFLSTGHDFKGRHGKNRLTHGAESVRSVECIAGRGLRGDRYLDYKENFKGQVTFFDSGVAEELARVLNMEEFDLSRLRRNVITVGVKLEELIGERFQLGSVKLEGIEECAPCYWMDTALGPGAEELMKGRGGLRCRILSSGKLHVGPVELKEISDGASDG